MYREKVDSFYLFGHWETGENNVERKKTNKKTWRKGESRRENESNFYFTFFGLIRKRFVDRFHLHTTKSIPLLALMSSCPSFFSYVCFVFRHSTSMRFNSM